LAFNTRNWKLENHKGATPVKRDELLFSSFDPQNPAIGNKGLFLRLQRRVVLCLAALAVLCFSCLPSLRQSADVPLTELHGTLDPLRNTFNKDVGKVRLMLLLDPT
jgi:hypothetical protein